MISAFFLSRLLKYEDLANRGGGAARNAALDLARGQRIAFVDSDDYLAPDMLERLSVLLDGGAAGTHKQVTMPHMIGEENDVPFALPWLPSVRMTSAPKPTATTSGFIRWSAVFPIDEKGASTASLRSEEHTSELQSR